MSEVSENANFTVAYRFKGNSAKSLREALLHELDNRILVSPDIIGEGGRIRAEEHRRTLREIRAFLGRIEFSK